MKHNVYRDGHVHVQASPCTTCVFRPGNQMDLSPGRLKAMAKATRDDESAIICHQTLFGDEQAVCRGFYDRWPTRPLVLADKLGLIREVATKK